MSVLSLPEALKLAIVHHKAGRLSEAESIYRKVLEVQPKNPDALNLLGVLAHQTGHHAAAAELISQALTEFPEQAVFNLSYGEAMRALGRMDEAISYFRKAVELDPTLVDAHNNLGSAHFAQGAMEESEKAYLAALRLDPGNARVLSNLAAWWLSKGEVEEAIPLCQQAVQADPTYAEAQCNLAAALEMQGRMEEALAPCERALALQKDFGRAWNNLAIALHATGKVERALECFQEALRLEPERGDFQNSLGFALLRQGRYAEALALFDKALQRDPKNANAHLNHALTLLVHGDYENGLPEYEWRWKTFAHGADKHGFTQPPWRGEDLAGRRLFVHAEQGLGDTIHMARYFPLLAQRGTHVILEAQGALKSLLKRAPGVKEWADAGQPLPELDYHCPTLSLPLAFGTRVETIPSAVPYLSASTKKTAFWRKELPAGPRVGLVWAGSSVHTDDRWRSIRLQQLAPLLEVPGIRFVSVQKGSEAAQARGFPTLLDRTTELLDFTDTAGLLMNLDLLITVDTAVAHLAGALGRPVWMMLTYSPDWRWGIGSERTPWYPTLRLFRQAVPNDWAGVIARVVAELRAWKP